jgi:phenylacetic acid degradation operon negative regulatory protein
MTVTLLADCTLRTQAWLPSAAIVELLTEAGVSAGGARTALSRLTRRGALESCRRGRQAFHRLTPPAAFALAFGGREIATFAAEAEAWDGNWTLIAFSVPQHGDTDRHALRGRLRWMGFAPLYDGLWVSPHDLPPKAALAFTGFDLRALTGFRAGQIDLDVSPRRDPLDAWDVKGIGEQYQSFLRQWSGLLPRIHSGDIGGAEAVRVRTEVMDAYRQFVVLDPRLPMRVMPTGWPRPEARAVFVDIYDGLAARALEHVLEVVTRFDAGPHPDIVPHTVAELGAGPHPPPEGPP